MPGKISFRRLGATATALCAVAVLGLGSRALRAGDSCRHVQGTFAFHTLAGHPCGATAVSCTAGTSLGGLTADVSTTVRATAPTPDIATTGVLLLFNDTVFHTEGGDLHSKETDAVQTTGAGTFAELGILAGGTGRYAGATGSITARGTFDVAGGDGQGEYVGEICTP